MSDQFKVVCGECQVPPEVVTDGDGNAEAICPGCGQRDKAEDAIRIAGEHYVDGAKAALNQAMRDATKGSKILKFESGFKAGGKFRWHAASEE